MYGDWGGGGINPTLETILLPVLTCSTGAEPKLSSQAGHHSRNKRSVREKKKKAAETLTEQTVRVTLGLAGGQPWAAAVYRTGSGGQQG